MMPGTFSILSQISQFLMVGSLNALLDISSLNLMLKFWPTTHDSLLLLFNTLAYLLAISNSYIWNTRLTFRHHARKTAREKIHFFLQAGISLVLSNLTFIGAIHALALFSLSVLLIQNIAKASAMAIPSLASFLFMKYFVFRTSPSQEHIPVRQKIFEG